MYESDFYMETFDNILFGMYDLCQFECKKEI